MANSSVRATLLGFTVPDTMLDKILSQVGYLPIQTHKFAWSLARALREGGAEVQLLSVMPSSNFPALRKLFFFGETFREEGFAGKTLGFINLVGLKHITRGLACLLSGWKTIAGHASGVVLVHGVHSPFLWFSIFLRRQNRKAVIVVTDPPGVYFPGDSSFVKFLKRLDRRVVKLALSKVDGVVVLTQALADDFSPKCKSLVLPGFMDRNLELLDVPYRESSGVFNIAYAGGLFDEYGVGNLIDAVRGIEDLPVRLTLYGKGDLEARIKEYASMDSRIVFGGTVTPKQLIPLLQSADLLVNPRPSNQDFVRHSFPSKLIEYMALGVPVLTTRLPGIPSDYLEKMYLVEDESAGGIRDEILQIAGLPFEARHKTATEARSFVVGAASEKAQGARIVKFLESF